MHSMTKVEKSVIDRSTNESYAKSGNTLAFPKRRKSKKHTRYMIGDNYIASGSLRLVQI